MPQKYPTFGVQAKRSIIGFAEPSPGLAMRFYLPSEAAGLHFHSEHLPLGQFNLVFL
jgi:hypothetical protein